MVVSCGYWALIISGLAVLSSKLIYLYRFLSVIFTLYTIYVICIYISIYFHLCVLDVLEYKLYISVKYLRFISSHLDIIPGTKKTRITHLCRPLQTPSAVYWILSHTSLNIYILTDVCMYMYICCVYMMMLKMSARTRDELGDECERGYWTHAKGRKRKREWGEYIYYIYSPPLSIFPPVIESHSPLSCIYNHRGKGVDNLYVYIYI